MAEIQYYRHGRFRVAGGILPDAITAYCTYGDPANPCIVFPTCYGGKLDNVLFDFIESSLLEVLDPKKYYIVTFALFSNGESSSPSNTDRSRAQYIVMTQKLSIKQVFCVVGFSMGGQQAYYWPVMYPDFVQSFLEGPKAALVASKDFDNGHYVTTPQHGIRAFGRAYSAWAYGQTWFREERYLYDGMYPDLQVFLREEWEAGFLNGWDANDLITLLHTWQNGDVSQIRHEGDLEKCLSEIKAKGLVMPCKTDLYFPPEDSRFEISCLKNARLFVIDSIWGHMAGGGSNAQDDDVLQNEIRKFLDEL
ncbi:hypothetical protein SERLADRAFT_414938 [Serpula lacrymans var. lacrymans S7.9]|uniref:AB hydrolase-1 domain-containing protein n=1 Tax=Serpula lacrymans var. lacrymans (strain S7.9) TaxID=578457 RepID=F8NUY0_SERL9|nr:uncharacterized protein SERLADRAFT_414938 [Serpula lacrymans var. lacrymans S7.9]EGO25295.1 hypothetical protein SERLADRAFT_414938 [Serpula lacrymans var. lacrymans S7.9]